MYIYIYIYIYDLEVLPRREGAGGDGALLQGASGEPGGYSEEVRAKYYTPEITKMKFPWEMPLNMHRTTLVTINWNSDIPLEHTADR